MSFDDLQQQVALKLDDFLSEHLVIEGGDWEEELEGYRDASKFSVYINYPNGEIVISPSNTLEGNDDITESYEIDYEGLRIGSYTGMEGHYIASHDWKKDDTEALQELYNSLEAV